MDLAGHERYFKTTAYGLTGHLPDYACLIVGANAGGCPPAFVSRTGMCDTSWRLCSCSLIFHPAPFNGCVSTQSAFAGFCLSCTL